MLTFLKSRGELQIFLVLVFHFRRITKSMGTIGTKVRNPVYKALSGTIQNYVRNNSRVNPDPMLHATLVTGILMHNTACKLT